MISDPLLDSQHRSNLAFDRPGERLLGKDDPVTLSDPTSGMAGNGKIGAGENDQSPEQRPNDLQSGQRCRAGQFSDEGERISGNLRSRGGLLGFASHWLSPR